MNFNHTGSYTFAPQLTGNLTVNKLASGTTILTGSNTYSGATTVSAGNLQVGVSGIGQTGTGVTSINSGGVLSGTGTVRGSSVTFASGSTLHAGDGTTAGDHGTLTFTPASASGSTHSLQGSVILGLSTATTTDATFGGNAIGSVGYNAWVDGITGVGSHDRLVFNNPGAGTGYSLDFITTTGSLQVVGSSFTPVKGQVFNLLDWSNLVTPNFAGFTYNSGLLTGNGDEGADLDLPDISASGLRFDFSRFTTSGNIVVVPEPSRALLLFAGVGVSLMRRRRPACLKA